jgi:hypothetical protein
MKEQSLSATKSVGRLGYWSALAAAITGVIFSVSAILDNFLFPLPFPIDQLGLYGSSLLIAPAFVLVMVCVHYYAVPEKRVWSHAGIAFAVMYAVMVSISYISQLAVVAPHIARGELDKVAIIALQDGSFMQWIDTLGYSFMGLSTLVAAPVFAGGRIQKWIRGFFIVNGILAPFYLLAIPYPIFLIFGIWWMVVVPGAMILLAIVFKKLK